MQKICGMRIDARLIHGQTATYSKGQYNFSRIVVVDNDAPHDQMLINMLKLSCPANTKLSILGAAKAATNLKEGKYADDLVFIICKGPETVVEMLQNGFRFDEIIVGNMPNKPNTKQIYKSVFVTEKDAENFHHIAEEGVKLYLQNIPTAPLEDLLPALESAGL